MASSRTSLACLIFLLTIAVLASLGPDPEAHAVDLVCGSPVTRVVATFYEGSECPTDLEDCSCSRRGVWQPYAHYAVLSLATVAVMWLGWPSVAMGATAVGALLVAFKLLPLAIYAVGSLGLLGNRAFNTLFGLAVQPSVTVSFVQRLALTGVVPDSVSGWENLITVAFWMIPALAFGYLTRQMSSKWSRFMAAGVWTVALIAALRLMAALAGWDFSVGDL